MNKHFLTTEVELRAGAEGVDNVDDQTVSGGPEGQRPSGYQQGYHMEQIRQVGCHIQRVVEGQHEHVASQDGNVIPHQVLLQCWRWGQTRLVDDLTHPPNDLPQRIGVESLCLACPIQVMSQHLIWVKGQDQVLILSEASAHCLLHLLLSILSPSSRCHLCYYLNVASVASFN